MRMISVMMNSRKPTFHSIVSKISTRHKKKCVGNLNCEYIKLQGGEFDQFGSSVMLYELFCSTDMLLKHFILILSCQCSHLCFTQPVSRPQLLYSRSDL